MDKRYYHKKILAIREVRASLAEDQLLAVALYKWHAKGKPDFFMCPYEGGGITRMVQYEVYVKPDRIKLYTKGGRHLVVDVTREEAENRIASYGERA